MDLRECYKTLGVAEGADFNAVKKAHRRLAAQYHPDRNPGRDTTDMFLKVQAAYEELEKKYKDPGYKGESAYSSGYGAYGNAGAGYGNANTGYGNADTGYGNYGYTGGYAGSGADSAESGSGYVNYYGPAFLVIAGLAALFFTLLGGMFSPPAGSAAASVITYIIIFLAAFVDAAVAECVFTFTGISDHGEIVTVTPFCVEASVLTGLVAGMVCGLAGGSFWLAAITAIIFGGAVWLFSRRSPIRDRLKDFCAMYTKKITPFEPDIFLEIILDAESEHFVIAGSMSGIVLLLLEAYVFKGFRPVASHIVFDLFAAILFFTFFFFLLILMGMFIDNAGIDTELPESIDTVLVMAAPSLLAVLATWLFIGTITHVIWIRLIVCAAALFIMWSSHAAEEYLPLVLMGAGMAAWLICCEFTGSWLIRAVVTGAVCIAASAIWKKIDYNFF